MLDWLFRSDSYFAVVEDCEFIEDAHVTKGWEGDVSHTFTVEFKESVRDGNKISHYNVIVDGRALHTENLITGETKARFGFNPFMGAYDFVFANEDNEVLFTDRVRVEKEV